MTVFVAAGVVSFVLGVGARLVADRYYRRGFRDGWKQGHG